MSRRSDGTGAGVRSDGSARVPARSLVFVDETWAKTNMTSRYGWGLRGERVLEAVPHGHWTTTTLIQAIDITGTRTAMITDGPTNMTVFETFVDWLLAPRCERAMWW